MRGMSKPARLLAGVADRDPAADMDMLALGPCGAVD